MQFTATIVLSALAALVSADGIFSITGTGVVSSPTTVSLTVLNGLVGDVPTCSGTFEGTPLPLSGNIPCKDGYALSFRWDSVNESIAATYTTPSSPAFTYNVPNLGCDDHTCHFGFEDLFPGQKVRSFKA